MKAEDVDLAHYTEGISRLFQSGLFVFLRDKARVRPVHDPVNYALAHVREVGRATGFQECLDAVLQFKELFVQGEEPYQPVQDYGGLDSLVKSKRISKEEADELRKQFTVVKSGS